jgi:hypothetical protein
LRGTDAGREALDAGEQHGRDARQGSADHGHEVDQGHPQTPQERVRHVDDQQRYEHHGPRDDRGQEVAQHVADHGLVHLPGYPGDRGRLLGRQLAQQPAPHLRAFEHQQQDQRIEQQGDEPGHRERQEHVAQPADQLAGQVGDRHHQHRDHNGPQRDVPHVGVAP